MLPTPSAPPPFSPTPVRQLLSRYSPTGPDEARHLAAILALLDHHPASPAAPSPADRSLLPPAAPGHLTASCFILAREPLRAEPQATTPTPSRRNAGSLLLIRHPKLHRWLQPGGHFEPGESDPRAAAARELLEETGLRLPPEAFALLDLDVHEIPANPKRQEPAHLHHDLRFFAVSPSRNLPPPSAVQDACQASWFDLAELKALPPSELDPGLLRVLAKLERAQVV